MVLKVKGLTKKIKGKKILNNISFEVKVWDIYGFLWPNWAWKTTTMKCIMWIVAYDSWEIEVLWSPWLSLENKKEIGFMPENTYLYKHLKTREFLDFNWKFFQLSWDKLEKRISDLLKKVGLEWTEDMYLKEYSKWMLQRIGLAQSIINKPKLLFLDEPMSWLDPIWRKKIKNLIADLKESGTTIFLNTHILSDVESICDKVSIIHKWNLIVEWKKVKKILEKSSLEDFFIEKVTESSN
jgi:ABC-2 type transport system ATP-binding protein